VVGISAHLVVLGTIAMVAISDIFALPLAVRAIFGFVSAVYAPAIARLAFLCIVFYTVAFGVTTIARLHGFPSFSTAGAARHCVQECYDNVRI